METREKHGPQKRKSIHDKKKIDEITDNVKNEALRIRSQRIYSNQSDNSNPSDDSSDSENEEDFTPSEERFMNETYNIKTRFENENDKINTSKNNHNKLLKNIDFDISKWIYLIFLMILITFIYFYLKDDILINNFMKKESEKSDSIQSVLDNVKEALRSLKSRYKNQDLTLWKEIYFGIESLIRRPHEPSIILLVGDKSDPLDCLAISLSNVSSNVLNTHKLILTPDEFDPDQGTVIHNLRKRLQDNKAVVIWDLLNINVEALKAFHNLCDRYNPLVEDVMLIITIIADNYNKESNLLDFVEKELNKKLSGKMKDDAIQPLITRITDSVILNVKPEPTVTDCPLPKVAKKN